MNKFLREVDPFPTTLGAKVGGPKGPVRKDIKLIRPGVFSLEGKFYTQIELPQVPRYGPTVSVDIAAYKADHTATFQQEYLYESPITFKAGDKVRLVRKVSVDGCGWIESMAENTGKTGVITEIHPGVEAVRVEGWQYWYPKPALELVEPAKPKFVVGQYVKITQDVSKLKNLSIPERYAGGTARILVDGWRAVHEDRWWVDTNYSCLELLS